MSEQFASWVFSKISRNLLLTEGTAKLPSMINSTKICLDATILERFNKFERHKMDYKDFINYVNE